MSWLARKWARLTVVTAIVVGGGIGVETLFFENTALAATCGSGDSECGNGLPPAEAIPSCVVTEFEAEFTITDPDPSVTVPTALRGTYTYPGSGTHDWTMTIDSGTVPTGQSSPYHTGRPWGINNSGTPFIVFYGATFGTTMTLDAADGPASIVVPNWSPNADADRWGGTSFRNLFVNSFNNVNVGQAGTYLLSDPGNQTTLASGLYPSGTVFTQRSNLTNTRQTNEVTSGTRVLQIDVDGGGAFEGWSYGATAKYTTCAELEQTGAWVDTNGNGYADVGDHIEYTYTASNNGSADWANAEVVDDKGGSLGTFNLGQYDTNTLSFSYPLTASDIAAGEVVNFSNLTVTDQFGNNVADQSDDPNDPTNNDANGDSEPDDVTIVRLPPAPIDLVVDKTDDVDPVAFGDTVTYTIEVTNNGPGTIRPSDTFFLFDQMPAGLTNPVFTPPGSATWDPATGDVTDLLLEPGQVAQFVVTGVVAVSGVTLTNEVTVRPPDGIDDPDTTNNVASHTTTVLPRADLAITKSAAPSPATAGSSITWTINVTNTGPDDATGVELVDSFPAGVSGLVTTGCTFVGDTCAVGDLAAGATQTVTVTGTVDATLADGSQLDNTASITSTSDDPNSTNDSATVTTPVVTEADLVVLKTSTPDPYVPGNPITYTLTVKNNGPSVANDVELSDAFPPGLTGLTTTTAGCTLADSDLSCALGTLGVGDTVDVVVEADTQPGLTEPLVNTATVSTSSNDPNPANSSSTNNNGASPSADLQITKTDLQDPVIAGTQVTYQVAIANAGPSDAVDVELTDAVSPAPLGLIPVGAPTIGGGVGNCTGLDCTFPTIAAGATVIVTYVFEVPETASNTDVATNTASVASATEDPDLGNNAAEETTDIDTSADLSLTKTSTSATPPVPGETYTYVLEVANAGPSAITGTTITDTLPADATFVSSSPPDVCTADGGEVTCDVAALNAAEVSAIEITVDIDPGATGSVSNTATVAAAPNATDPNPANNTDIHDESAAAQADLAVTKSVAPAADVSAGTTLEWTIAVTNNGPSVASSVSVEDIIPAGVTVTSFESSIASATCTSPTSCDLGDLGPGANATITIVGTIDSTIADGTELTNSVTATSIGGTPDPIADNNTAAVTSTVRSVADVGILKTAHPNPAIPGEPLEYTISVTNAGPSTANGVAFDDPLPEAFTYTSHQVTAGNGTCSVNGGLFTCQPDPLAPLDAFTVVVTGDIDPAVLAGFDNTATLLTPASYTDPVSDNNSATVTVGAAPNADLGVSKTPVGATTVAGTTKHWTVTVTNGGPSVGLNAQVADVLPNDVTFVSATPDLAGATCTHDGAATGGTITCDLGDLAVGAIVTIDVATDLPSSLADGAVLSNSVTIASDTADDTADNDAATAATTVSRMVDLSLTKVASEAPLVAGKSFAWTLTASNAGPSDAANVVLNDSVPSGFAIDSISPSGCVANGNDIECALGALGAGESIEVTINATPSSTYLVDGLSNPVINTAQVIADEVTTPSTASATSLVTERADVAVTKTTSATTITVGDQVTWTIDVTNLGPSGASDVIVTDVLPAGVVVTSADVSGTGCTLDGAQVTCALGLMSPGTTETIVIDGAVPSSYLADGNSPLLINEAEVATSTSESDVANNSASAETEVTELADLTITKVADRSDVVAGTPMVWTLTVGNAGPADARNVVISDPLPGGFTATSITSSGGGNCDSTVTCNLGTVAVGAAETVTIEGVVDDGFVGTAIENVATVSSDSPLTNTDDDSASAAVNVTADADLAITKSGPTAVTPGTTLDYEITVTNNGPSVARAVSVAESLPPSLIDPVLTPSSGSCDSVSACELGDLAVGQTVTIQVTGTLDDGAVGEVTNAASVTSGGGTPTPDSNPDNNAASTTATAVPVADVSASKSDQADPVTAGTELVWTITVANAGPSVAREIIVTDVLPPGVTLVSAPDCTGSTTLSCEVADLAPNASATIDIAVDVGPDYYTNGNGAPLENTATVTAAGDTNQANNSSLETTTIADVAGLSIAKDAAQATAIAGEEFTWTLTVLNNGPSDAQNVVATDTLPNGTTFVSATTDAGTCNASGPDIACDLATVAAGATVQIEVVVEVDADYVASGGANPMVNSAADTSDTEDPTLADNTAIDNVPVVDQADLAVTKQGPATARAGDEVEWTVTVTNDGPSVARNVVLDDPAPPGVTISAVDLVGNCTTAVSCSLGDLSPNQSVSVVITGIVDADWFVDNRGTQLTNTASVSSDTVDAVPADNTASMVTEVTEMAATTINKSASPNPVNAGEAITWALTVGNAGPSTARDITVSDPVPDGVSVSSATVSNGQLCTFDVSCTIDTLAPSDTVTITIVGVVDSDWATTVGSDTLANVASVITPTDPGTPKTAQAVVDVATEVDLAITKTDFGTTVTAGESISWRLTAENAGPSRGLDVTISDTMPAGIDLSTVVATVVAPGVGSCDTAGLPTLSCEVGDIAAGGAVVVDVSATVSADYVARGNPATMTNTATVTNGDPSAESNPEDNTSTVATPITSEADLTISKTGPDAVRAGDNITWQLAVGNDGPSAADTVVISDVVPAGLTIQSATPDCAVDGSSIECSVPVLAPLDTHTVTIVASVPADYIAGANPVGITNTASVSSNTPDAASTNNSGSADTTIEEQADLKIAKSVSPAETTAGSGAVWTVEVTNDGPSVARGVVVVDQLPSGFTPTSVVADNGAFCDAAGTCTLGDVAVGETVVVTIDGTVDSNVTASSLTNTASASGDTPDPDGATASADLTIDTMADLAITKQGPAEVTPGDQVVYSIVVDNLGPSDAIDVVVAELLPDGLSNVVITTDQGTCSTETCALGTVPAGAQVSLEVTATIDPGLVDPTLTNTVSVESANGSTPDGDTANNTASATSTVTPSADLIVTKADLVDPVTAGEELQWRITVENAGPSTARDVNLTDTLPEGVTLIEAPSCVGATELSCALGDLAPGDTTEVMVTVAVDSTYITGDGVVPLRNTATAASATDDNNTANNSDEEPTTIAAEAGVSIAKDADTATEVAGGTIAWTLTVTNAGPSAAADVVVTDPVPDGLTITSATFGGNSCTVGTEIRCDLGVLSASTDPADAILIEIESTVDAAYVLDQMPDPLANVARVATSTAEAVTSDNEATDQVTISAADDVTISKSAPATAVAGGDSIVWTLSIGNAGPSVAQNVVVSDPLPAGLSGVDVAVNPADAGTCDETVRCEFATLAPDATIEVTITADVPPTWFVDGGATSLVNTATVTSDADTDLTNNTSSAETTIGEDAPLTLTKSATPATVIAGETITWTVAVANTTGPSTARDVVVSDLVPDGVTITSATIEGGACTVAVECTLDSLAVGASAAVAITGVVDSSWFNDGRPDTITNTATATSITTPGVEVTAQATSSVALGFDLGVTKASPADPVAAGETIEWLITVANTGSSDAPAATLSDTLPDGLDLASVTVTPIEPVSCDTSALPVITCDLGQLAADTAASVRIAATVRPEYLGDALPNPMVNTAAVTTESEVPDLNPDNDSATASTTIFSAADVSVTKVASPEPAVAGETIEWTVVVTNAGPSVASGVAVVDTIPTGMALTSATTDSTDVPTCPTSGQSLVCSFPAVGVGQAITISVLAVVDASYVADGLSPQAHNTVLVTTTSDDQVGGNDQATSVSTIQESADLVATKVAEPAEVIAGSALTWTIEVTNAGSSVARSVELADALPAGYSVASVAASNGASCDSAATCLIGDLAPNESVTMVIEGAVDADVTQSALTNTATATSVTPDPNVDNSSAAAQVAVTAAADVELTKSGPATIVPGEQVTYQIRVKNNGPSVAADVGVLDAVPVGLSSVAAVSSVGSCTSAVSCDLGDLGVGEVAEIEITAALDAGVVEEQLANTASVSTATADPKSDNDVSTVSSAVTPEVDLQIRKDDDTDLVVAGGPLAWTIDVVNAGPSIARGVVVTDVLPDGVTLVAAPGCTGTDTLTCEIADLNPQQGTTLNIAVTVDPSYYPNGFTSPMLNSASVSSATADIEPGNNGASDTTTIGAEAGVSVAKDANVASVNAGDELAWTLTVHNAGPSTAESVVVTDPLPPGAEFVSAVASNGGGCDEADGEVSCDLGDLGVDQTVTVNVVALIASDYVADDRAQPLANVATVASPTTDPVMADNTGVDLVKVVDTADLVIQKTAPTTAEAGESVGWSVVVSNPNGPSVARNVTITDLVPDGVTVDSVSTSRGEGLCDQTVNCSLGELAVGDIVTVNISGTVDTTWVADGRGDLVNTAIVESATADADPANNRDGATTSIEERAALRLTKVAQPEPVVAGTPLEWTIELVNDGPSAARHVELLDPSIIGTTVTSVSTTGSGACTFDVQCSYDVIDAGEAVVVTIAAVVAPSWLTLQRGVLVNTATATTATSPDTEVTATAESTIVAASDLSLVKTANAPALVSAGEQTGFTITVANEGPSDAANVTVTDTVPAGLVDVTVAPPVGFECDTSDVPTVVCTGAVLAAGTSVEIPVVGKVSAAYFTDGLTTPMTNTAEVAAASDQNQNNNSDTATVQVANDAGIAVGKSAAPDPVVAGETITWTIVVSNAGPGNATEVSLSDAVPVGVTVADTGVLSPVGQCQVSTTITCQLGDLAPGATVPIVVTGVVAANFAIDGLGTEGQVVNTVSVATTSDDGFVDDNAAEVATVVDASSDLRIEKSVVSSDDGGGEVVTAGRGVEWTIEVDNVGPSVADAVVISDSVPPGVTIDSVTTNDENFTCATGEMIVCEIARLAPSADLAVPQLVATVAATVDPAYVANGLAQPLTNTASVTSSTPDPTPATAAASIDVAESADLNVEKSASVDTATAGADITWTVAVSNQGPSVARSVVMSDDLLDGLELASATASNGGTCSAAVECALGDIAPGSTVEVTLVTEILSDLAAGGLTEITNQARAESLTPDPQQTVDPIVTVPLTTSADLSIVKSDIVDPVLAGTNVVWVIDVVNSGPSVAQNVAVVDTPPDGIVISSISADDGSPCTPDNGCVIPAMQSGESRTITVVGAVDDGYLQAGLPTPAVNTASVTSDEPDPDASNNNTTEQTTIAAEAGLSVVKTASTDAVNAGEALSWEITVRNAGPSIATDVRVDDPRPAGVTIVSATAGASGTCDDVVVCDIGQLLPGEVATIDVDAMVDADAALDGENEIRNTVSVSASVNDPVASDNTSTATTPLAGSADLSLVKTAGVAVGAGGTLSWSLVVSNAGPSSADSVVVTDDLPDGLVATSVVADNGSPCTTEVRCELGVLDPGQTVVIAVETSTPINPATTEFLNSAQVVSVTPDPDVANNGGSATGTVLGAQIGLALDVAAPTMSDDGVFELVYDFTVVNSGSALLSGVQIIDDLTVVFGDAASWELVAVEADGLTVDSSFDGIDHLDLLTGEDVLGPGDMATIRMVVSVVPAENGQSFAHSAMVTAAPATGIVIEDVSQEGRVPDVNDDGDPGDDSKPTVSTLSWNALIGAAKKLAGSVTPNDDGTYSMTFDIDVNNFGDVDLTNLQIDEDLSDTFADAASFSVVSLSSSDLTVNPDFDGVDDTGLLAGTDTLPSERGGTLSLQVSVRAAQKGQTFSNQVVARADDPAGESVEDRSEEGSFGCDGDQECATASTPSGDGGTHIKIPDTGARFVPYLGVGVALLTTGVLFVVVARRRRRGGTASQIG